MFQYEELNKQFIGGKWQEGSSPNVLENKNPYTQKTFTTFRKATADDVDEAYRAAALAKKKWDAVNPFEKRTILEKAVTYIEENEEAIIYLIMEELGGTRLKAAFEIGLVKNIMKEAATFPIRMEGKILPSTIDGKENRLYRVPAGVVGVISPFNFPFFLSMKSVAPALGAGNGVVLKPHEETPICGGTLIAKIFENAGIPAGLLNVVVTDIAEIGDSFVEHPVPRIISFTGSTKVGDPMDPDTIIGPLINSRQTDGLMKTVEQAIEEGAVPVKLGGFNGTIVEPTILKDVKPFMSIAKEELFGPVVSFMKFDSEDEAVDIANETPFGLSGAVHTSNLERGVAFAKRIETGMIHVNDTTINDEPNVAFGGEKQSGLGRLNGEWSLEEFTTLKWISVQHEKRSFPY